MMVKGEDLLYSETSPRGGVLLYSRSSGGGGGGDLLWEMIHYMTPASLWCLLPSPRLN